MTEQDKAREARARAHADSVTGSTSSWTYAYRGHIAGGEEERAAADAKLNHEVYLSDKRAQERDRAEAKCDALAEKVRVLQDHLVRFGRHRSNCQCYTPPSYRTSLVTEVCDCGFIQALRETGEGAE